MDCIVAVAEAEDDEGGLLGCQIVGMGQVPPFQVGVQMTLMMPTMAERLARCGWLTSHVSWEHDGTAVSPEHRSRQPAPHLDAARVAARSPALTALRPY